MTTYAGTYGPEPAFTTFGQALENTSFAVTIPTSGATATLYTDRTKATTAPNPTATDALGNIVFFADPGQYVITLNNTSVTVTVYPDPSEPSAGVQPILYNVVASSWPARPATTQLAAGYAMYISPVSTAANPTDIQTGDTLFIPNTAAAPVLTNASPPNGVQTVAYSYTFTASNNPSAWAVASGTIPAGLTFNTSTGVLSGTPSTAASYTFSVSATNSSGTVTTPTLSVTIGASGGNTVLTLDNTAADWSYTNNFTGVAADSVNQHNSTNTVKATTASVVQPDATVGFKNITASAGDPYDQDTIYVTSVAGVANRKAYSGIIWKDISGGNISTMYSASIVLTNAWQALPALINNIAPAGTAAAQCIVVYSTTDGSNMPSSEVLNWSET